LFNEIGLPFRKAVLEFAEIDDIPVPFRQGRPQDRRRPPLPRRGLPAGGGGDRDGPGVPVGDHWPRPHRRAARPAAVFLRQGRSAGQRLLLPHMGRRVRAGFIQMCTYFPSPAEVAQRARVGQAAGHGRHRLHRAGQRVRVL
jgi:hypothetical protein